MSESGSADREAYVQCARDRAELLYLGDKVAHRSCGIAIAETFGLRSVSYQSLRRGGLTGEGTCGAIQAGILVLGELLGDPDPVGMPTAALRDGVARYRSAITAAVGGTPETSCNVRTERFPQFVSRERLVACTSLAVEAAGAVAGVLWDLARVVPIPPAPES